MQKHADRGEGRKLYKTVKTITKKFKPSTWTVADGDGNNVTDIDNVVNVWKEYCSTLYDNPLQTPIKICIESFDQGPGILLRDVEAAIKKLANNKATGPDAIPAEAYKLLDDRGIKTIHQICQALYELNALKSGPHLCLSHYITKAPPTTVITIESLR